MISAAEARRQAELARPKVEKANRLAAKEAERKQDEAERARKEAFEKVIQERLERIHQKINRAIEQALTTVDVMYKSDGPFPATPDTPQVIERVVAALTDPAVGFKVELTTEHWRQDEYGYEGNYLGEVSCSRDVYRISW